MSCLRYVSVLDCSEVYAAREKNGIYIPKERYTQEEAEKKVQFLLRNKCHSHFTILYDRLRLHSVSVAAGYG